MIRVLILITKNNTFADPHLRYINDFNHLFLEFYRKIKISKRNIHNIRNKRIKQVI
jgi:hypothetical protein